MRVPVKLLGFSFWLFFLNCAQCQECRREDIKYENTELVAKASYAHDETVKVNCMTGYTGMYKLKCERGEWKKSIQRPCAKKKCGNPGHIPNGHFDLTDGTEFVFGATVVYTCKEGYEMTSRINQRTCRAQGWDNALPVCEEVTCELKSPTFQVKRINPEGKTHFRAGESAEITCSEKHWFYGTKETSRYFKCQDDGQWDHNPVCQDATCQEQDLKNIEILCGYPSTTSPYKPGHVLVFRCIDDNMRFYGQRAIECQPDGRWNYPYPQCGGMVQCSKPTKNLQFVTLSDEKTEYSNSETLTYMCNKPYNESTGGVLMCQNGNWNGTYDCRSKICPPPPYLQHGDYSINSTKNNVITAVSYTCQAYYVLTKQQDVYKCVNGKWETPPKCLRPCEIDDFVEKYNLQLPTGKVYIRHAEKYRLNCRDG